MLNFRKIAAASNGKLLVGYYTERQPEAIHAAELGVNTAGRLLDEGGKLTTYYTGRDSRAAWRPDMHPLVAEALGINPKRAPRDEELARLFEGKRADTGAAWSRGRREISGFDFTFAPHKSVTLAAEFASMPSESAAILNAIHRAADAAMRHLASDLGWARMGAGGKDGAEPGVVGWVTFQHGAARPTVPVEDGPNGATYRLEAPVAGDPHAHIHGIMYNMVVTANGHIGSLDTKKLTDVRVMEGGAYFQAFLADELRKLGMDIAYDEKEMAVVLKVIPEYVNKAYSKRERDIEQQARTFAETQGLVWNEMSGQAKLDVMHDASVNGKLDKMTMDERRIWREQQERLGWTHETAMQNIQYEKWSREQRIEMAYVFAAKHLAKEFYTAAVISHDKLSMYAMRGLIGAGFGEGATDSSRMKDGRRVVAILEQRGITLHGERVALVSGLYNDTVKVTNTAQIRVEQDLMESARANARDFSGSLSEPVLAQAMADNGKTFTSGQKAAIRALGTGGALTMLTGVAGSGKTTLLEPLVAAWQNDARYDAGGRRVVGAAMAWRQADALKDAGITETFALSPLLRMIEEGAFKPDRNTVLVLDEVSQIGPRPLLKLLQLQAETGMTIKMLGDREQAQAIEAGDSIKLLRKVLPAEAMPELLTTVRQSTRRGREVAGLFREGTNKEGDGENDPTTTALKMKRDDGHAVLMGGDQGQVVERIADLYLARRDMLLAGGAKKGITVTAPTNEDVANISQAIRRKLQQRGEISRDEVLYKAVDQAGRTYDLAVAQGDLLRLFRRTYGKVDGKTVEIGSNGSILEVMERHNDGLTLRTNDGRVARVDWDRLTDDRTGRLQLGFGHAMTIDSAQGVTSAEHINAMPRGTAAVTGFTSYVAESRATGVTWTVIAGWAMHAALNQKQAMGDITPVTEEMIWAQAAKDMGQGLQEPGGGPAGLDAAGPGGGGGKLHPDEQHHGSGGARGPGDRPQDHQQGAGRRDQPDPGKDHDGL